MACRSAASSIISMKARCPLPCGSARCFETKTRGPMTKSDFGKLSGLAAAVLTIFVGVAFDAQAQQVIKNGDILSGQLNAMHSRAKGKRVSTFQLVSAPHRLPPPNGLCNLETGPETFQIVTNNDAQAAQLKDFVGKQISVKVDEVACAEDAGQMSEAVVTKGSVVTKHCLAGIASNAVVARLDRGIQYAVTPDYLRK